MGIQKSAGWIWTPSWEDADRQTARAVYFRKEIRLSGEALKAELTISADTRYKLYINGEFVQFGPSKGDDRIWFQDRVDAQPYLHAGRNVIAVLVLRYPEDPQKGNHGMFRTKTPGLYLAGSVEDEKGESQDISADNSWRCIVNRGITFIREEERFAPLMIHEKAAGSYKLKGWMESGYADRGWEDALIYTEEELSASSQLTDPAERTIPYLYRRQRQFEEVFDDRCSVVKKAGWEAFLKGKADAQIEIPPHTTEEIVLSAGEEMTGYMRTELSKGAGAEIEYLYAEAYVQDETVGPDQVPVKKDRLDKENGHLEGYRDLYMAAGYGTEKEPEVYEPYWFRTFRFVRLRIRTSDEPLILKRLDYEETGYPLDVKTQVETSDESLKEVWEISERTLKRCMHETYEDCPYYEQLQYIMDSRQQILYTYCVSADDRLARKCMDDLRRSQRPDGLLNCSYPNCTENVIPGFPIYYILMVHDHMMYFGERDLVREHLPVIDRILDYFHIHLSEGGYVGKLGDVIEPGRPWSFIDWAAEWRDTAGMPPAGKRGALTMESLLYIYGLQHAAELYQYTGNEMKAENLRKRAGRVQDAVRIYCTGKSGLLQDGPGVEEYSQHCQVFALLTDTVDGDTGRENLIRTFRKEGYAQCTIAMSFYLFRALEKAGLYEYTESCWDPWRRMAADHCTTCVESEAYARSECHGWGALILYELPSVTLGVRPAAPGYRRVQIAPVAGYMNAASGCVETPVGSIHVSWEMKEGKMELDYTVPDSVEVI